MAELGAGNGSDYPGALDTDATLEVNSPNAGKTKARAEVPNDLAAAVIAIQTELGLDPAGSLTDVVTWLQTEHGLDGTHDETVVGLLAGAQLYTGAKTFEKLNYEADAGGTDAYAVTINAAISSLKDGMFVIFKANTANTAGATLEVNSLGAVSITKQGGTALETGDITAGQIVTVAYDTTGPKWQMQSGPTVIDSALIADNAVNGTHIAMGSDASGDILYYGGTDYTRLAKGSDGDVLSLASGIPAWSSNVAKTIQIVGDPVVTSSTGTTIMPDDDTIPQNTEGDEYMTQAITVVNAGSKLKIEVVVFGAQTVGSRFLAALFQDSTANALAAGEQANANNQISCVKFTWNMAAGSAGVTTFKVRAGPGQAATFTFNGESGSRVLGGVLASSLIITEYTP